MESYVYLSDVDARRRSAEMNGRLFCVGLSICNLAGLFAGFGGKHLLLAILSIIPIGLSVIVSALPTGWPKMSGVIFCMAWAAAVAVLTIARAFL